MNEQKVPIGIKIITIFYYVIAVIITGLFIYAHIVTPMTFLNKLIGFLLAVLLGFSVFFIARNLWEGQSWARIVMVIINGFIILTGVWVFVFGKVRSAGAVIYLISILLINGIIIFYLFSKKVQRYFNRYNETFKIIREEIKKLYEKNIL